MTSAREPRNGALDRVGRQGDIAPGVDDPRPSPDDGPQRTAIGHELRHDLDTVSGAKPLHDGQGIAACDEDRRLVGGSDWPLTDRSGLDTVTCRVASPAYL